MIKPTKNRRKAIIGTVLFHIGLLLCFIFMGLNYQIPPPPEEGITINFGYQDFGSGSEQTEQIVEEQEITPQEIVNNNPVVEDISTQDIEETPTTKLKEHLEESKEVKKIEEKKPEPVVNTKALYPGKKQNNSNSQGISEGQGDQGSQDGDPNSNAYTGGGIGKNGIAYQLGGRTIAEIKKPNYDSQQQGKVVVTIRVDRNGKVISATPGAKGSTTTNAYLYSKAKEAALKTTFEANTTAPEIQVGTIIYNFKLN
ncbi:MAG: energy transducer TonB [Flavobacteriia bacterium]|nr:energy transducer TonB [Flavobacteriia bacterium]